MTDHDRATEVAAMLVAGRTGIASGSPHLALVSDRSELDARISQAKDKHKAIGLFLRNGKFKLAKRRADELSRLLSSVNDIGFDWDEGFGE
jgi:hypothetical protein